MRYFITLLLIVFILGTDYARGQASSAGTADILENLFSRLIDNYNDQERISLNDSITLVLSNYAKSDSVFKHKFDNLRFLGQITSPDSMIKIISWNLVLENQPGRYNCFIIRKMAEGRGNRVYPLSAAYEQNPARTDTTYDAADWYGALYYNLKPVVAGDKRYWILLGLDYGNAEISRKIIDVLSFRDDDSICFGRKWFADADLKIYRVILEYGSNAMMTLRFRSGSSVIFDHLAPFSPSHKDDKRYYGPDYSFDTYDFDGNEWKFNQNVDARNR